MVPQPSVPHTQPTLLPVALPLGGPASAPTELPSLHQCLEQGPQISKPHSVGTWAGLPGGSSNIPACHTSENGAPDKEVLVLVLLSGLCSYSYFCLKYCRKISHFFDARRPTGDPHVEKDEALLCSGLGRPVLTPPRQVLEPQRMLCQSGEPRGLENWRRVPTEAPLGHINSPSAGMPLAPHTLLP